MSEMKLLPCPFCGGDAQVSGVDDGIYKGYYVACNSLDCYCCVGEGYDRDACPDHQFATESDAAEAWNTRPTSWRKYPEEKPEAAGKYIIWTNDGMTLFDYWHPKLYWQEHENRITAWQPLPEPFKGGE